MTAATARKLTYGGAASLDGFIAGPGEALDWLRWSDEAAAIMTASFRGVDTILMGRKTWEAGRRMGGGPALPGVRTIVFSRRLAAADGAELVRGEAAEYVARLKAEPGGDIILMGGGELAAALIAAGLIDEIGINLHPVLLGGGVPMFGPAAAGAEFELAESRPIAKGCVLLMYRKA